MCTYMTEKAEITGSGKGHTGWFTLRHANVYYDHPIHAPMEHALAIDFVNEPQKVGERVAVEMSAESALELGQKIYAALGTNEDEPSVGEPKISHGIVEAARIYGSAKGPRGWFTLRCANVFYDQPSHAPMLRSLNMNFLGEDQTIDEHITVEVTPDSALELVRKIHAILDSEDARELLGTPAKRDLSLQVSLQR